ncbi:acyl-CoA thioesterase [Caldimonas sp. KR1-144]|uniref:acyl-CoA thioesterase n=1 Tax=Caldimonas sp. KR1-144 TaxID=3400911 RepID=UPI003C016015
MDDDTTTYRGTVYPWHCDHMGHMNVMWYVGKFDEALWSLLTRFGLTPGYMKRQQRGMAALEQKIQYHRELLAGDVVAVRSVVVEQREKVLLIRQTMLNVEDGHAAATMDIVACHIDTAARRAVAFPEAVVEAVHDYQRRCARPLSTLSGA